MMPNWTNDQMLAIKTRGGKVIVSAAAGSGKTAVLSERVIDFIMNGGNVNKLLIVTFTKAAAGEMKERIKKKISNACLLDDKNEHLKKQLILIETAKITTMDAFYGELVKNNFYKLGIRKDFSILTNEEEQLIKNSVCISVLEKAFNEVEEYEKLLNLLNASSINLIKNEVIKLGNFLDTLGFKDDFIKNSIGLYKNGFYKKSFFNDLNSKMDDFKKIYQEIKESLFSNESTFDKVLVNVSMEQNIIDMFSKVNNFDELSSLLRTVSFERLSTPRGFKDDPLIIRYKNIRDLLKKEITKNLSLFINYDENCYEKEISLISNNLKTLFKITINYQNELIEKKKKINKYSFSDIAHFVIDLLINQDKSKTELAKNISNLYDEILIDEYQDTNDLQNTIFKAISKDSENLFTVGDVKQSIYRFRSAKPEIFNNDKDNAFKDKFPRIINLSKNFRSRKQVLDFCNFIFSNTMTREFGEVDYNDDERLYLGANYPDNKASIPEIHIINNEFKEDVINPEDELTKDEKEAVYVAEQIKSLLDQKYQVFDQKINGFRNILPNDIVILLRSFNNADLYRKALSKKKIGAFCEKSPSYFDNYEIKFVINILKVIINKEDDVSLLSILLSPVFRIDVNLISIARSENKNQSLYASLKDKEWFKKIDDKLISYYNYSLNNEISSLINFIYTDLSVIPILSSMQGGEQRERNLVQMVSHALVFEKNGPRSLHEFVSFVEEINLSGNSLEGSNPTLKGDNVLITSIHKSKGLEYPVVFICETGKAFNKSDMKCDFVIGEDVGVCLNTYDEFIKTESLSMNVFKQKELKKSLSEELRIFYVALTRAKEKIIITASCNNLTNVVSKASPKIGDDETISGLYLNDVKSYLDILIACLLRHQKGLELRSLSPFEPKAFATDADFKLTIFDAKKINEKVLEDDAKIKKEKYNLVNNDLYGGVMTPSVLSVSEIKKKENDFMVKPTFMTDGVSHNDLGTLYHRVFELLDVKKYTISQLVQSLDKLVIKGLITNNEKNSLDINKIFSYLTCDIYDMMLTSDEIYKEKSMTFKIPASYYDKEKTGSIVVDAVIDLLIKKKNSYIIVDYKTDNVNSITELKDRYSKQLDLYEMAVKQTLNATNVDKYIYSIKLNKYIKI